MVSTKDIPNDELITADDASGKIKCANTKQTKPVRLVNEKIAKPPLAKGCLLPNLRSPVPKLKDLLSVAKPINQNKNYLKENIHHVKSLEYKERPPISQDSCDGHRQDLERAGLQLKYVFKKEYGQTPRYIRKYRQQAEAKQKMEAPESPKMRYVDEEEKQLVLKGLRSNLQEVEKRLLSLPVITDTISKQKRKTDLENRLIKLEQDIEMLEKNEIIVIKE